MNDLRNKGIKARGIRNNNPGNLRLTSITWEGKEKNNTDGAFEQFTHVEYGIRAMFMDIINDVTKDGKDTLTKLINEYAPPSDKNDTTSYINAVSKNSGLTPTQKIPLNRTTFFNIIAAKIKVENGSGAKYINSGMINKGFDLLPNITKSKLTGANTTPTAENTEKKKCPTCGQSWQQ